MNVQELIERLIDLNRPDLPVEVYNYDTEGFVEAEDVMILNLESFKRGRRTAVVIE